jgi:iron complex outermembrane receptor protein
MQRVNALLWSTTALSIALGLASPAIAQDQVPPPPPNPNAKAQTAPITPPRTADAPATPAAVASAPDEQNAIVVTGLRRSLQSARNIKKNSTQQVDAIVAEDIGKLPDIAVSDTAARIPGVQVDRGGGEAGRVLVRGFDRDFYETTYNGREIFTAETRTVALQDFPSANIAALEVFKTSTADLVEPGIAGLINVRSRRPFDFKGLEIAGSAWELHAYRSRKWKPNGNLLLSDRWRVGDGEFGALINFSYTELQYLDAEISNTDFIADPTVPPSGQHIRLPDIQRIFYGSGDRKRPSINGALQWRPDPDTEIYFDGLWQGFRNQISDRNLEVPLWGGSSYTNLTFRDGTNLVSSGTVTNPFRPDGFQGGTFNKTDTYQFAIGGRHDMGPLRLTADLARTKSTFTGSTASVDYAFSHPVTVDFNSEIPTFTIENFDPSDPANYIYRGFYEENQVAKGKDWQARLDGEYQTDIGWLPKIQAGFRYTDRDASRQFGNRYVNFESRRIPITDVPLDYQLFQPGFRGVDNAPFPDVWLAPTYSSIRNNTVDLRQFGLDLGTPDIPPSFGGNSLEKPAFDPAQSYSANEKTTAAYGQLNYSFGSAITVDGVLGLRMEHTRDVLNGSTVLNQPNGLPPVIQPITVENAYTNWLPNLNMNIHFTRNLQLRLAATKTRTRPTFAQLSPTRSFGPPPSACVPDPADPFRCALRGNAGNVDLKPYKSNNYDASLEYYFSRTGSAAVAVFRRDLNGFIENQDIASNDPTLGPIIVTEPINTGKGKITGFEAQAQSFLDLPNIPDWARGFGALANVTYVKAETGFPDGTGNISLQPILGVSKWTYNLAAMYEKYGFTARLSYNWRGSYTATIQNRGDDLYFERVKPISRLDLSTAYSFNDNFTVFFDWTNILKKPFRSELSSARAGAPRAEYPRFVRYEETILSGGIRFRFGGSGPAAAPPPPVYVPPPPPPPAAVEPAPQPAPPPPPPPTAPERG